MPLPFGTQVRTEKGRAVLHEESQRIQATRLTRTYECHQFTLPSPATNFSLKNDLNHVADCTCGRAAFDRVERADRVSFKNAGAGTVSLKLVVVDDVNPTQEDPIPVRASEEFGWDKTQFNDLLLSNSSGVALLVRIVLA